MIQRESAAALGARWQEVLTRRRWPAGGMVELTWACTFGCRHCYLPDRAPRHVLDGDLVIRLLDELAQAGCLSLCWTGGEALLHPRFSELHARAHRLGFWITLFTNGSLLDAAALEHLARFPPRSVEVTLYGGDPESYRAVTGSAHHFAEVARGVDGLLAAGHKVLLKAMLTRDLAPHLESVQAFARARGQELRLDPVIDRCLDGSARALAQRPAADSRLRTAVRQGVQLDRLCAYDLRVRAQRARGQSMACGAAHSGFLIDVRGALTPCVMLREPAVDLRSTSFAVAWDRLAAAVPVVHPVDSACGACELQHLCNLCPGVLSTMRDAPEAERAFYCQVARGRAELLSEQPTSRQAES